jgi:hypothetical protein
MVLEVRADLKCEPLAILGAYLPSYRRAGMHAFQLPQDFLPDLPAQCAGILP